MAPKLNPHWPVLTRHDADHLRSVALPLGGIGTGTVCLGGRGNLRDWEIVNRPAKGFEPRFTFFALYARRRGERAVVRCLEGRIPPPYEDAAGFRGTTAGLPRFRNARFAAAYPLGQVLLSDRRVPVDVRIEGFNPMIPADTERSGIPVAVLRFVLSNPGDEPVTASVCGSVQSFIGTDGAGGEPRGNVNEFRQGRRVRGLAMRSEGVDPASERWGTMALTTTARSGVTHRTAWQDRMWFESALDFFDDFGADGRLHDRPRGGEQAPLGSLAVRTTVPAGGARAIPFLLTWHFPNRQTWSPVRDAGPGSEGSCCGETRTDPNRVGNHYATRYADAWDVAERVAADLKSLERDTVRFVRAFCDADLPREVKEAALYNASTLRTQTVFRVEEGYFCGFEGCRDESGCCPGTCTHVWNYEHGSAFLFGEMASSMRESEFLFATDEAGLMSFRMHIPRERGTEHGKAAADGQMGCIMRLYREWQLSGDDDFLRRLWPAARRALEFAWIPGGWDADQDGVMEGCQHHTADLEFYGPNPLCGTWYLGALRAAEEMARHLGHDGFADRCCELFEAGSRWLDEHLFNGEYYEHEIRPPAGPVAAGLQLQGALHDPAVGHRMQQPGASCVVDQMVGQYMSHVLGLGYILDPDKVRRALKSVMKHNFRRFGDQTQLVRAFALNEEEGLLVGTYPRGNRPERPFFRFGELWSGLEYTAAVGMLYEGQVAAGLRVFRAVRARHDGSQRNPFDEPECGHHYARAMASWAGVLALTGFHYSAVDRRLTFAAAPEPTTWFWSTGYAYGTVYQRPRKTHTDVQLRVLGGTVKLDRLALEGRGEAAVPRGGEVRAGRTLKLTVRDDGGADRSRRAAGAGTSAAVEFRWRETPHGRRSMQ